MVSYIGLVGVSGFESPLYNLLSFTYLKVHERLFVLFDSPCADMGRHVKEDVKDMILKSHKFELLGYLVV